MPGQDSPSDVVITIQVRVSVSPSGSITTQVKAIKPIEPIDPDSTIETTTNGKSSGVPDFLPIPDPMGKVPYEAKEYAFAHKSSNGEKKRSGACAKAHEFIVNQLKDKPSGILEKDVAKILDISDGAVWYAIDHLVKTPDSIYERYKDLSKRGNPVGIRIKKRIMEGDEEDVVNT